MISNAGFMLAVALVSLLAMKVMPRKAAQSKSRLTNWNFRFSRLMPATPPQSVTVTNRSSSTIRVTNILISGIDFSQSNSCDKAMASGDKCSIEVSFHPATSGTRLGALQIAWSGGTRPRMVPLTGTAP